MSSNTSAPLTLERLNSAPPDVAAKMLDGLYEHTPWIVGQAMAQRPFKSLAHLKHAMAAVLTEAGTGAQKALIRAHPELAGKAMVSNTLTAESTHEQQKAGLTQCTPEEFAHIQELNATYNTRFGWPFILAVRGPRGVGLTKKQIIATFERRLNHSADVEFAECLRNIHRIAEIRLSEKFGQQPTDGEQVWDWCEALARHSEPAYAENNQLTVTYLTPAHQACAADIAQWMRDCGFDEVEIDAVGNVVGIYYPAKATEPAPGRPKLVNAPSGGSAGASAPSVGAYLLTGSHYDTVRNGGKYDGRLGIFVAMQAVRHLAASEKRLPFGLEVVAFAEEEGQRYKATFLGSGALVGQFNPAWLDQTDADDITLREAMQQAGLPATLPAIQALQRDPANYLAFVEVHIEQGPVLNEINMPLGVVTSINGSARYLGHYTGVASHAGTTPMNRRRDAATATAELALYAESRALADEASVATIGQLTVPSGSINVVPGRCQFSLDMRAPTNALRNALVADVKQQAARIAERRRVSLHLEETMIVSAAPSAPEWMQRWEAAVQAVGLPVFHLPSGAGHDAMKLHEVMPQAMLFVRGENFGISHNPLESTTAHDMQLAVDAFSHLLNQLATVNQN
jgi:N-carbamoyl-L-amino-acid hydrolase